MFESLRQTEIPLAALYFGLVGIFVILFMVLLPFALSVLIPNNWVVPCIPVPVLLAGYVGLFVAYGKAHRNTAHHNTSTFWIQFFHGVVPATFAVLALLPRNEIDLAMVVSTCSVILFWYYLNFLALCLSVWTKPPLAVVVPFSLYVVMIVFFVVYLIVE